MTNFTAEEIRFLKDEFGFSEEKIKNFTAAEWDKLDLHNRIADIAIDEAVEAAEIDINFEPSARLLIAESITDRSPDGLGLL